MHLTRKQLEAALELLDKQAYSANCGIWLDEESHHKLTPIRFQVNATGVTAYGTYLLDEKGNVKHSYTASTAW